MTAVRRRLAVRRDRSTAPSRKMRKAFSARKTCLSGDSDTVSVACIKRKQPYPRVARPSQVVRAVSSKKTDASLSDGKPQQERRADAPSEQPASCSGHTLLTHFGTGSSGTRYLRRRRDRSALQLRRSPRPPSILAEPSKRRFVPPLQLGTIEKCVSVCVRRRLGRWPPAEDSRAVCEFRDGLPKALRAGEPSMNVTLLVATVRHGRETPQ